MTNAAEVLLGIIGAIDKKPKLPINISEEPPLASSKNLWIEIQNDIPRAYLINCLLEKMKEGQFTESRAVLLSSYQLRWRVQMTSQMLRLLSDVDIKDLGGFKNYVLELTDEGFNPEEMDRIFFSQGSALLWDKFKEKSFHVIRRLAPRGAGHMIKALSKI